MGGLTREALAERAGVHIGFVDRLVELGILVPPETGSLFTGGDLRRVRLVRGLDKGGLPLEGIGTAVRNRDLSFGFLDLPSWDWYGGFVGKTYRELSAETGLGLELLQVIRESMGFARPEPEDPVHEEVLDLIPVVKIALEAGADPVAIERLIRVWGESMRRITEAAGTFYHAQIEIPLLRSGMSEAQVLAGRQRGGRCGHPLRRPRSRCHVPRPRNTRGWRTWSKRWRPRWRRPAYIARCLNRRLCASSTFPATRD